MDGVQIAVAAGGVVLSGLVSYFTALTKTRVDVAQISTKLDAFMEKTDQRDRERREEWREDFRYIRDRLDRLPKAGT